MNDYFSTQGKQQSIYPVLAEGKQKLLNSQLQSKIIYVIPIFFDFLGLPSSILQKKIKLEQTLIENLKRILTRIRKRVCFLSNDNNVLVLMMVISILI